MIWLWISAVLFAIYGLIFGSGEALVMGFTLVLIGILVKRKENDQ